MSYWAFQRSSSPLISIEVSMSLTETPLRTYYAARAAEYDGIYLKPERQRDLRAIESWLPAIFTGASVLEVACGTGYWTQFIAQTAAQIVAVDASTETMDIAKSRVAQDTVAFHVGDAYALSPHLGIFNAAFAGFWYSHIPKARRHEFSRALHARLAPGSKVVFLDNLYVEGSSSPISEVDADCNTYQVRKLKDGSSHQVIKNFPSESELQSSIHGFGERGVYTTWDYYWAFEYVITGR